MNEMLIGFLLGIALVTVSVIMTLGVIGFFKGISNKNEINYLKEKWNESIRDMETADLDIRNDVVLNIEEISRNLDKSTIESKSYIDSKFDKLTQKIEKTK